VLSWVKFPKVTPPVDPVVQKVIGPPAVPIRRGLEPDAPEVLTVIRPTDLRVKPLPADEELTFA
jgi:hypothetical protein